MIPNAISHPRQRGEPMSHQLYLLDLKPGYSSKIDRKFVQISDLFIIAKFSRAELMPA
jgi:hypothetical protein